MNSKRVFSRLNELDNDVLIGYWLGRATAFRFTYLQHARDAAAGSETRAANVDMARFQNHQVVHFLRALRQTQLQKVA